MNMGFMYSTTTGIVEDDALDASEFTTVVQQLIAAEFKIDLNYNIASDNQNHMVLVKQADLNTSFRYYAVPKLDPGVYLVAQMTKLDELQLVPAKANIFFDGTYIGETYIDPTTMDDTLNLPMGKDPNIVVKRTLLKNQSKERIIQDKKERSFAYNIEVRNLKSSEVELIIQDQIFEGVIDLKCPVKSIVGIVKFIPGYHSEVVYQITAPYDQDSFLSKFK